MLIAYQHFASPKPNFHLGLYESLQNQKMQRSKERKSMIILILRYFISWLQWVILHRFFKGYSTGSRLRRQYRILPGFPAKKLFTWRVPFISEWMRAPCKEVKSFPKKLSIKSKPMNDTYCWESENSSLQHSNFWNIDCNGSFQYAAIRLTSLSQKFATTHFKYYFIHLKILPNI